MNKQVTLLAVPTELLENLGIDVCDTLEMYEKDGALVIRQREQESGLFCCGKCCPHCQRE